jgi:hypothetical protein
MNGMAEHGTRSALLVATGIAALLLTACGSSAQLEGSLAQDDAPAPAADQQQDIATGPRSASAVTYTQFFYDAITEASAPNWNVTNTSGNKQWALSNTAHSAPKAWVIGQNYWNNEEDYLVSDPFTIPGHRQGLKLGFRCRYRLQPGDKLFIQYSKFGSGNSWNNLQTINGGQNAAYPAWNKLTYDLAGNDASTNAQYRVRFIVTSDGSGTDWGAGIDNVSVYQENLAAPTNLMASDSSVNYVGVAWGQPAEGPQPDGYKLYRSTAGSAGPYYQVATITEELQYLDFNTGVGAVYWYKVKPFKTGWADGPYSNKDSGYRLL